LPSIYAIITHAIPEESSSALPLRILILHLLFIRRLIGVCRILLQHTLTNQIRGLGTIAKFFVQGIGSHVFLEFALLALDGGCGGGVGKDVTFGRVSSL
jgi:hypothetical protein